MSHSTFAPWALGFAAIAAFSPQLALAADTPELQQIREEITQLKASYDARIQALEKRLAALQPASSPTAVAAQSVLPTPTSAAALAAPPPAPVSVASASAFNPAIALVLGGTFASLSRDPAGYQLPGFMSSGGEVGPGSRGLQIGESELSLSASIDPTLSGRLTFALSGEGEVEVEEAVFERQGLFNGATLRGGRFLSGMGYLNGQHAHTWDFVDAPLVYQAFFGGPAKTDGLQLRWLAPTERFFELGAELGSGQNFPGAPSGRNGVGSATLFAHLGDDLGDSASWRLGMSYLHADAVDRSYEDLDATGSALSHSFTGTSKTWALDGVYKWAPHGNRTRTNFKLQAEYFQRTESGNLAYDTAGLGLIDRYQSTQSGWYMQAVYQFLPQWRLGLRHDQLDSGTPELGHVASGLATRADFPALQAASPSRSSVMLDYSPSEFSRFRLQLAHDRSNPFGLDRQLYLQYTLSLGAHSAHSF